jgi:cephalosporin hydroxylase
MEAIDEFQHSNPGLLVADPGREDKFGCTFSPRGYFVRA